MWGFGGFGYDDDGRVDRGGWSEKSAAAFRREQQAKQLLDAFLLQSAKFPPTDFPKTHENLVTANVHLTQPCWLSFRKYALSKGCHVRRREATLAERRATGDKRKGKMYVISATLPVHPSQAVQAEEQRKEQAAASLVQRKEREAQKAIEKERENQIKRQRISDAYHQVVANLEADHPPAMVESSSSSVPVSSVPAAAAAAVPAVASAAAAAAATSSTTAASMAPTNESSSLIVEDPQSLLNHAEQVCQERLKEIRSSIYQEKRTAERELEQKQKALEEEALEFCQKVKRSVLASMPRSEQCSACQTKCKILVAECIRCNHQICAKCIRSKVKNEHRCHLCLKAWLGTKVASSGRKDDSSIQHQHGTNKLAKFVCEACLAKHPWDNFEYACCCERYVCNDHRLDHDCCVCSGARALCTRCGIGQCSRCGKELCSACSFKEGCMCSEKSGRRLLMEELGEY